MYQRRALLVTRATTLKGLRGHPKAKALGIVSSQIGIIFLSAIGALIMSPNVGAVIWEPVQEINVDILFECQFAPSIAVEDGRLHVVWGDWRDGDPDIYYRRFNGSAWEPVQEISTDAGTEMQADPRVAVDNGEVHVVWADERFGGWDVYYRYFDGTNWQAELELSSDDETRSQWFPRIAAENGRVHVVWEDHDSSDTDIVYRYFDGATWQPEQEVPEDPLKRNQGYPEIAAENGRVHVVWTDHSDWDGDVFYRHFDGASWQTELELSEDNGTEYQVPTSIAVEDSVVHVTWQDWEDGDSDIFYRYFDGVAWQPELKVDSDTGIENQTYGQVAAVGGRVHIVWGENIFLDGDIFYKYFDGTSWHSEVKISTDVAGDNDGRPAIAAEGNEVHVVWSVHKGPDCDIYYRKGTEEAGDVTPPKSSVHPLSPYWRTTSSFDVEWAAWDDYGLANVSIYYRYSPDNSSWTSWEESAHNNTISGTFATGSFPFMASYGEGYYQFYSIAVDEASHVESTPIDYDAICGYDPTKPLSSVDPLTPYWHAESYSIVNATATDALSGVANVSLWYRHSSDNATWGTWVSFSTDDESPWSWFYDFPDGDGFYQFQSRAIDIASNAETKPPAPEAYAGHDGTPPVSNIDDISPYWFNTSPITITASATDNLVGVYSVEMNYRHSLDNATWTPWTSYATDTGFPWSWSFDFLDGEGYYELHSVGVDNIGNTELPPPSYDAICGYDPTPPSSVVEPIIPHWHSVSPLLIDATAQDATSGVASVSIWYRHSPDNTSWSAWSQYSTDLADPWSWSFDFPDGEGHYEFYSVAVDVALNVESKTPIAEAIVGFSTSIPGPPGNLNAILSGSGSEDILISWTLSPDDGQGRDNVARYDVNMGSVFDPTGLSYILSVSVPAGTTSHIEVGAGEGDPENHFYRVCAVSISGLVSCYSNQAAKFTRSLAPGPNLVSIPLVQYEESIETVLQTVQYDKAWFYDAVSQEWKWCMKNKGYRRGLWSMNPTMGMWVNVTEGSNLTVAGMIPAQTTIHLHEGWNLVSFPAFNTSYTVYDLKTDTGGLRVEGYDPSPPYHLRVLGDAEVLQAGYAYWVKVGADVDWIVEVS